VAPAAQRDEDLLALVAGKPAVVPADVAGGHAGLPVSPAGYWPVNLDHLGARRPSVNVTP